jgi:hypothetical protein
MLPLTWPFIFRTKEALSTLLFKDVYLMGKVSSIIVGILLWIYLLVIITILFIIIKILKL